MPNSAIEGTAGEVARSLQATKVKKRVGPRARPGQRNKRKAEQMSDGGEEAAARKHVKVVKETRTPENATGEPGCGGSGDAEDGESVEREEDRSVHVDERGLEGDRRVRELSVAISEMSVGEVANLSEEQLRALDPSVAVWAWYQVIDDDDLEAFWAHVEHFQTWQPEPDEDGWPRLRWRALDASRGRGGRQGFMDSMKSVSISLLDFHLSPVIEDGADWLVDRRLAAAETPVEQILALVPALLSPLAAARMATGVWKAIKPVGVALKHAFVRTLLSRFNRGKRSRSGSARVFSRLPPGRILVVYHPVSA